MSTLRIVLTTLTVAACAAYTVNADQDEERRLLSTTEDADGIDTPLEMLDNSSDLTGQSSPDDGLGDEIWKAFLDFATIINLPDFDKTTSATLETLMFQKGIREAQYNDLEKLPQLNLAPRDLLASLKSESKKDELMTMIQKASKQEYTLSVGWSAHRDLVKTAVEKFIELSRAGTTPENIAEKKVVAAEVNELQGESSNRVKQREEARQNAMSLANATSVLDGTMMADTPGYSSDERVKAAKLSLNAAYDNEVRHWKTWFAKAKQQRLKTSLSSPLESISNGELGTEFSKSEGMALLAPLQKAHANTVRTANAQHGDFIALVTTQAGEVAEYAYIQKKYFGPPIKSALKAQIVDRGKQLIEFLEIADGLFEETKKLKTATEVQKNMLGRTLFLQVQQMDDQLDTDIAAIEEERKELVHSVTELYHAKGQWIVQRVEPNEVDEHKVRMEDIFSEIEVVKSNLKENRMAFFKRYLKHQNDTFVAYQLINGLTYANFKSGSVYRMMSSASDYIRETKSAGHLENGRLRNEADLYLCLSNYRTVTREAKKYLLMNKRICNFLNEASKLSAVFDKRLDVAKVPAPESEANRALQTNPEILIQKGNLFSDHVTKQTDKIESSVSNEQLLKA